MRSITDASSINRDAEYLCDDLRVQDLAVTTAC